MKKTEFIHQWVLQTPDQPLGLTIKRGLEAVKDMDAQGIPFDPEDELYDRLRGEAAVELIQKCVQGGTTKHGMAGECLLLNEKLTEALRSFK